MRESERERSLSETKPNGETTQIAKKYKNNKSKSLFSNRLINANGRFRLKSN